MMEANLFLGATSILLAAGAGVVALVLYRKNGNGHAPEPGVRSIAPEVDRLTEAIEPLAHLPVRLEQTFRHLAEQQAKEPEIPPEWVAEVLQDLERIEEKLVEPAWPAMVRDSLEAVCDQLELMNNQLAIVPPTVPGLEDLIRQIEALVDAERKRAERPAEPVKAASGTETSLVTAQPSPTVAPPAPRQSRAIQRAAEPILLEEFNTLALAEFTIYKLYAPEQGVFSANILNLGPGWLYMRENAEPTIGDPKATSLPPNAIDNEVRIAQQLYVLASADGTITVRLMN